VLQLATNSAGQRVSVVTKHHSLLADHWIPFGQFKLITN